MSRRSKRSAIEAGHDYLSPYSLVPMRPFQARAVMPKAALMDAGLAWLFELIKTRLRA